MMRFPPIIKVSFGLVLVTISLFLFGDLIGIVPDEERGLLEGRKKFSESLAIQFSTAVTNGNVGLVSATLDSLVNRDDEVLSVALRASNGRVLSKAGDHSRHWTNISLDKSTSTHVQVPVFQGQRRWGTVEVAFAPLHGAGLSLGSLGSLNTLIAYLTLAGFFAYWFFIKRTLRELDPRSVIPERVKSAFNGLAEGLMIMDEKEQIILANTSFAEKVGYTADTLLGRKASGFNWQCDGERRKADRFPWEITLTEKKQQTGVALKYKDKRKGMRTFMVNTTPITDSKGAIRGVMATFDDLTDLEKKQVELKQTVFQLENSREKLREKTVELEFLATRDSLTGCLNRRAFFEKCENLFEEAVRHKEDIACIMMDIDHFKSVNDRYGHATGDKVIQLMANELRANARPDDIVGRYGGEEFCVIMPRVSSAEAGIIAERLRAAVKNSSRGHFTSSLRITASFGVAELSEDITNPGELIDRADKALYIAKENGRNRVVRWKDGCFPDEEKCLGDMSQKSSENMRSEEGVTTGNLPVQGHVSVGLESGDELYNHQGRIAELEDELNYLQDVLTRQVGRDTLTGLPNRLLFHDRISQALARGQRYDRIAAVIVLDIDMFQRINEALGTVTGNQLIKKVADRLGEVLRNTDTISHLDGESAGPTMSRTGADEFGILLTDMKDTEMVTWVVKRILDSMSESLEIDGHELFITCSAGISLFPHDSDNSESLLEAASAARYKAKQRLGKNNLQFYSADINQDSYRQIWFESQLHHALAKDEFTLNYQPKIDLASGRITSMEALIRWNNSKLGFVPPNEFIPIAERTGLINEIGEWVVRSACQQAKCWADAGFDGVGVAVNLSPLQFRQKDLCQQIVDMLAESDLAPELVELEITESAVMDNFDRALDTVSKLHQAGLKLAVDDFGTGYSSLAYLKHLPVSTLKIDRSFLSDTVLDKQDALIINAIIAMAHSMSLSVVAEGVETEAQKDFLVGVKCDEIQGYYYSKPVVEKEVLELLRKYNGEGSCHKPKRITA